MLAARSEGLDSPLELTDKISGNGAQGRAARQRHGQIELLAQHFQNRRDPGFPTDGQPPKDGTPNQDGPRAVSERFEHVGPSPDAPVHVNFNRASHRVDDFRQRGYGRRRRVQLPSTVVGHDDAGGAVVDSPPRDRKSVV